MFRVLKNVKSLNKFYLFYLQKQTFLTNEYKCADSWNMQRSSPILSKVNLNDFYIVLDQNFGSKGTISATDVDVFANAIKDRTYLDELRDLLYKLRLSAETGNTLESTHHATIRNYIEFGEIQDIIEILKEPLLYGIFLDDYTANMLLDKLVTTEDFENAAIVASLVMKQEDYSNKITSALCQYACYKYIQGYKPPEIDQPKEESKKKVEEIKIRVKFLRNPYFDDHFDIKDTLTLSGKTLAWMSEPLSDNISNNMQLIGWLYYRKYDKLKILSTKLSILDNFKIHSEILDLLKKEIQSETLEQNDKDVLEKCITDLSSTKQAETSLEESIKVSIENAINKSHKEDVGNQLQLFKTWAEIREEKLNAQVQRLDRAKRVQLIQEKQEKLKEEEQKLWFFENQEEIDLKLEEKEKHVQESVEKTVSGKQIDENYIPPEILPKMK